MTAFESTRSSVAERVNVASAADVPRSRGNSGGAVHNLECFGVSGTDGCEVDFGEVPPDLGDVSTGFVCEASDFDSAGTSGAEGCGPDPPAVDEGRD